MTKAKVWGVGIGIRSPTALFMPCKYADWNFQIGRFVRPISSKSDFISYARNEFV